MRPWKGYGYLNPNAGKRRRGKNYSADYQYKGPHIPLVTFSEKNQAEEFTLLDIQML